MIDLLILCERDYELLRRLQLPEPLRRELDRAIVVSDEAMPEDVVTMSSSVLYTDETAGVRRLVRIVHPAHADSADGRVSVFAPVGSALLGLSAGQAIDWDFPDGTRRRLRVEEVLAAAPPVREFGRI